MIGINQLVRVVCDNRYKLQSLFYSLRTIIKMNQDYQGWHYFTVQNEPKLEYLPLQNYQRKPSQDNIFTDLIQELPNNYTGSHPFSIIHQNQQASSSNPEPTKKSKKKKEGAKILKSGQQRGHWKSEENKRYHWFLEMHSNHFLQKHLRRMDKIFKSMQAFIATRQAEQCRSHHQKMEKKYGTFINILKELRRQNYGEGNLQRIIEDMQQNGVFFNSSLINIEQQIRNQYKTDHSQSEKSTIEQLNENVEEFDQGQLEILKEEGKLDAFNELDREYQPFAFFMF